MIHFPIFFFLDQSWLANTSFIKPAPIIITTDEAQNASNVLIERNELTAQTSNNHSANTSNVSSKKAAKHKHLKKKHHKHHKKKKSKTKDAVKSVEFTGKEEYYVDKRPERSYMTKNTLEKTICPRYRVRLRQLGSFTPYQVFLLHIKTMGKYKRYYRLKAKSLRKADEVSPRSTEKEFQSKTKKINKRLTENPNDIKLWLELVKLQDNFYMKSTKAERTERKINILKRALIENLGNNELYREYIRIIKRNHPSFEVSKILESLLEKGNFFYLGFGFKYAGRFIVRHFLFISNVLEYAIPVNNTFSFCRSCELCIVECSDISNTGFDSTLYCTGRFENIRKMHEAFV